MAKPGDPGQAGTYDPKQGGKFSPERHTAFPSRTGADHGSPGEQTKTQKEDRKKGK